MHIVQKLREHGLDYLTRDPDGLALGEAPEFLVYFPELAERLAQAHAALQAFLDALDTRYATEWSVGVESQWDFALRVKDLPFSAVLFQARAKSILPSKAFHGSKDSLKADLLIDAIERSRVAA